MSKNPRSVLMGRTVSVSVVFTDLVGSTELSSRVGPEQAETLRQVHFGLLRAATTQHGGTEVKNLGDGLMVVFPSVGAAIDGAVAMQQAVARHNRRAAQELSVRIGISSGDAVEEDGDYFGETVVEAARLCARADGGEILAAEVVAVLGRGSGHEFEAVGALDLKGLPASVPTVRVCWSGDAEPEVRLPPRLESALASGRVFVGREHELELLRTAHLHAQRWEIQVVFLAGEPGVGKTALVSEFARSVHHNGTTVLYGRCDEELALPYQPWAEALGHLIEHAPEPFVRDHVEPNGSSLARLVPQLAGAGGRDPHADAETERYLMFGAVCSVVEAAARERPLLVVLDDLHWADAPTLALLRHVVSAPLESPPLIVATYRDTDVSATHPLVAAMAAMQRQAGFQRIHLRGLDADEVAQLVEARSGTELTGGGMDFARALHGETNGNPFYTREILRDLLDAGELARFEAGEWPASTLLGADRLPESVLDVVRQRVQRLGRDVYDTLAAASVIGRDFDLALLARVLEESEDPVLERLERAASAAVIDEVDEVADRYAFTHALAQHAMQADMSAARRRRVHRRVAESIEELWPADVDERAGELAGHWLAAATAADAPRAADWAERAGRRALDSLAPDEALRWFGAALDLVGDPAAQDPSLRGRLLVGLGTAQRQLGDAHYRETLLDAARVALAHGDAAMLVEAALTNNRGYHSNSGEPDHERLEVIEAALEAVGDEDSTRRALLLATLCAESNFHRGPDELQALADDALDMARRLGDPRTISEVTSRTRVAVFFLDTITDRYEVYAESRRLADEVADPTVCFHAAQALLWAAAVHADIATFDEQLRTMTAIAERTGQPILRWLTLYTEAMRAAIAGDAARSESLAGEAFEIGVASGQPDAGTFYGAQIMRVRMLQGRMAELAGLVDDLAAQNPDFGVFRAVHAAAAFEGGDRATAEALLDAERAIGFDSTHEMQWATAMTLWAETAARLEHRAAAAELYPLLARFADLTAFTGLTYGGPLAHYAGDLAVVLGDRAAAGRHFATAWEMEERSSDPYMRSLTLLGRARLHLLDDDGVSAHEDLAEAGRIARARGFGRVEGTAAELLALAEAP